MSADEQGYNGWKNYETWAVGMYLDGEVDWRELAEHKLAEVAESVRS